MIPLPREIPLFKISLAIVLGIFGQEHFDLDTTLLYSAFSVTLLLVILLHFKKTLGIIHLVRSALIYIAFSLVAASLYQVRVNDLNNEYLDTKESYWEPVGVLAECISNPKSKKLTQFYAKITHVEHEENQMKPIPPVKVLVHLYESETTLEVGDVIHFQDIIKKTSKSNSPKTFNYREYLKYKGIAYQTYLSEENIEVIERKGVAWYVEVRNWAIAKFEKNLSSENVAIASALILGYRGFIDDELYKAFAETGSMHVLAVSGLHVGIVSMLLGIILGRIKVNYQWVKISKSIVLFLGIWAFAFITGGSSSVLRASAMFSFFEISRIWRGHLSVYNSIGSAATILLLVNPFSLFQVGFQLSFSAILSIVLFCKKIQSWCSLDNYVIHKLWGLLSVAMSVQVLTLPISLYYFHQFPTYFPVTGITAVLSAIAILSTGLITLLLSPLLEYFESWQHWLPLDLLVTILRESTDIVHSWPYGLIENIALDLTSVAGLFVFIGLMTVYAFSRNKIYLISSLIILLAFFVRLEYLQISLQNQDEIVVYDSKNDLIDIFINGSVYSYAESNLTDKNIEFATEGYRIHKRAKEVILFRDEKKFKSFISQNEKIVSKLAQSDLHIYFQKPEGRTYATQASDSNVRDLDKSVARSFKQ